MDLTFPVNCISVVDIDFSQCSDKGCFFKKLFEKKKRKRKEKDERLHFQQIIRAKVENKKLYNFCHALKHVENCLLVKDEDRKMVRIISARILIKPNLFKSAINYSKNGISFNSHVSSGTTGIPSSRVSFRASCRKKKSRILS